MYEAIMYETNVMIDFMILAGQGLFQWCSAIIMMVVMFQFARIVLTVIDSVLSPENYK